MSDDTTPAEGQAETQPEYVTKETFDSLSAKIDSLAERLSEPRGTAPADEDAGTDDIDALYEQILGGTSEEPQETTQDKLNKELLSRLARMEKAAQESHKAGERTRLNAEMRAKHPDWAEFEDAIWTKVLPRHPNASDEEALLLARAMKHGFKTLTQSEQKGSKEAVKEAPDKDAIRKAAASAASAKPNAEGVGATEKPTSIRDAARLGLEEGRRRRELEAQQVNKET